MTTEQNADSVPIRAITMGEEVLTWNVFRGDREGELVREWTPEMQAWHDSFYGGQPRCTGETYNVNPDAPEEGTDIHHESLCPAHPDAKPGGLLDEIRQAESQIGTE